MVIPDPITVAATILLLLVCAQERRLGDLLREIEFRIDTAIETTAFVQTQLGRSNIPTKAATRRDMHGTLCVNVALQVTRDSDGRRFHTSRHTALAGKLKMARNTDVTLDAAFNAKIALSVYSASNGQSIS